MAQIVASFSRAEFKLIVNMKTEGTERLSNKQVPELIRPCFDLEQFLAFRVLCYTPGDFTDFRSNISPFVFRDRLLPNLIRASLQNHVDKHSQRTQPEGDSETG